eukprot:Lithocolla_globosa_v1_NODE_205_length_5183_cov_23.943448.p2 type:complete len:384 gc:universal NODE_205_length_5183_cov_23.943448:2553-1402(-)
MKAFFISSLFVFALADRVPLFTAPLGARIVEDSFIAVFKSDVNETTSFVSSFSHEMIEFNIGGAFRGFHGHITEAELQSLVFPRTDILQYVEVDSLAFASDIQTSTPTWGIDRVDQERLPQNWTYAYHPNPGAGVNIYILDTGIRVTHTDFGGRASFGFKSDPSWSDTDLNGHGTHVASTAGGTAYGVAKAANLVAVKVMGDDGTGAWSGVIDGINWVVAHGTANRDVINLSISGGAIQSVDDAVNSAAAAGITNVVAAGNFDNDACNISPARATGAFTVMAVDNRDARSGFSSFGSCCDIFAPGSSIRAAWHTSDTAINTISGTSMASPHVAGATAIAQGMRQLSPADVKAYLVNAGTRDIISNPGAGSPNVNLYSPHPHFD